MKSCGVGELWSNFVQEKQFGHRQGAFRFSIKGRMKDTIYDDAKKMNGFISCSLDGAHPFNLTLKHRGRQ